MSWTAIVLILSAVAAGNAINRPVYKIALTQKGFAQVNSFIIWSSRVLSPEAITVGKSIDPRRFCGYKI